VYVDKRHVTIVLGTGLASAEYGYYIVPDAQYRQLRFECAKSSTEDEGVYCWNGPKVMNYADSTF